MEAVCPFTICVEEFLDKNFMDSLLSEPFGGVFVFEEFVSNALQVSSFA